MLPAFLQRLRSNGLLQAAVDLFYPRQCRLCGATTHCERFAFLCAPCFESAPPIAPPWCDGCGLPFEGAITGRFECPNCAGLSLAFDRARSGFRFRGAIRQAIHHFKYSRQSYWLDALQAWFHNGAARVLEEESFDLAVPVPLHSVRERERGFNQAWALLGPFAAAHGFSADRHALSRIRSTETQTHLDREQRLANLRGAFAVKHPERVRGRRILLVDDVLTTGSTTSECARVLKRAGAASVLVFTLARG